MKEHKRKFIAPIIVAIFLIIYFVVYFGFLISLLDGVWKWLFAILPIVFAVVTVKVCIERINEIRSGEEDDISKY